VPKQNLGVLLLATVAAAAGCSIRPGMNADCAWPPEAAQVLNLVEAADARHLVLDTEVVEELVDRYRFHPTEEQRRCEERLITEVARIHSVTVTDVARARERIPHRGLDLPVTAPVSVLFLFSVVRVLRWIERRFAGERIPLFVTLVGASVALSGLFTFAGEFWTSILQMVRVGSQHVGGRVTRLPWLQHQAEIFAGGIALFWAVQSVRWVRYRTTNTAARAPDRTGS
jgi:hypothetical protein